MKTPMNITGYTGPCWPFPHDTSVLPKAEHFTYSNAQQCVEQEFIVLAMRTPFDKDLAHVMDANDKQWLIQKIYMG